MFDVIHKSCMCLVADYKQGKGTYKGYPNFFCFESSQSTLSMNHGFKYVTAIILMFLNEPLPLRSLFDGD